MPYIEGPRRYHFDQDISIFDLVEIDDVCAGDLNYIFTKIINRYMHRKGEKYQHYNDVIGALEACKLELYRRRVAPYEDKKIAENGNV